MRPIFIDIEASSWATDSYPIEIAWGGTINNIVSYLINPSSIEAWIDWDSSAENAHGISRGLLLSEGISPYEMCDMLEHGLAERTVYTDAPDFDGMWLFNLFEGCKREPISIDIRSFDDLMIRSLSKSNDDRLSSLKEILHCKLTAKNQNQQHRAAWDVEYLIRSWEMTQKSSSQNGYDRNN